MPVEPVMPVALRVLSTALGDVRTTVPVSLRGTAWLLASLAVCGVTPTPAGCWLVPMPCAGALPVDEVEPVAPVEPVVPAVPEAPAAPVAPVDCANTETLPAIMAVASRILVVVKVFMIKITPVGLKQVTSQASTQSRKLHNEALAGVE